jgi:hypothetical protein
VEYFGGYTSGNPYADSDNDGVNDLGEFNAETDPWDKDSCLQLTQFWREPWGDRCFSAPASDCRNYSVQITWDLMMLPALTWWDWGCTMTRTNGAVIFNEGSSGYNPTLYRIIANIP